MAKAEAVPKDPKKGVKEFKGLLVDPDEVEVVVDPTHWLYDPRVKWALKERTIEDYMEHGVHQTIALTKEGDKLLVVAGRRRVLHAREANKRLVAAGCQPIRLRAIMEQGEKKSLFGVMLSENEHREGDGPIGRARKVQRALDFGATRTETAIHFGVTEQTIGAWLKLLTLPEVIQEMVESGQLSVLAGVTLAEMGIPEEALLEEAKSILEASGKRTTARQIRQRLNPDKPVPPQKRVVTKLIDYADSEEKAGRISLVSPDFIRGIRWREGRISDADAGLTDLLARLATLPAKRKSKKAKQEEPSNPEQPTE